MASKTIITDDLGGTGEATTIEFAFRGTTYLIDLNAENQNDFDLEMQQWIEAARPKRSTVRRPKDEADAIREWAAANGYTVAAKGRIPQTVLDAYAGAVSAPESPAEAVAEALVADKAPAKKTTRKAPQA